MTIVISLAVIVLMAAVAVFAIYALEARRDDHLVDFKFSDAVPNLHERHADEVDHPERLHAHRHHGLHLHGPRGGGRHA
ncbi:hypothetical protein AB8O64_15395 [Streptomyces sp. QH1-20]|uniref:hypothetical protein n=1 Tax=Streptomyces sp. QH1-20 TaxID=3240934 RepID=UPI0035118D50